MWRIQIDKVAEKFLLNLEQKKQKAILDKLRLYKDALDTNTPVSIDINDIKKLKGNWDGFYRIRVGDIRVIFSLDYKGQEIKIADMVFRGDAY